MLGHSTPNFRTIGRCAKYAPDYLGKAREALDDLMEEVGRVASRPIIPVTLRASSMLALATPAWGMTLSQLFFLEKLERAKGFEPSTPTLARLCSTTELRPLGRIRMLVPIR